MQAYTRWVAPVALAVLLSGCAGRSSGGGFTLTSSAFRSGQPIPVRYTTGGQGISPPLAWSPPPKGTKELVLIVTDPDAFRGTYYHWTVYGLAPAASDLAANMRRGDTLLGAEGKQGKDTDGDVGYTPPDPPPGKVHHYEFRLYALDHPTGLAPRATPEEVMQAVAKGVLAQAQLVGTYQR